MATTRSRWRAPTSRSGRSHAGGSELHGDVERTCRVRSSSHPPAAQTERGCRRSRSRARWRERRSSAACRRSCRTGRARLVGVRCGDRRQLCRAGRGGLELRGPRAGPGDADHGASPLPAWLFRVDATGPGFVLAQGPRSSTSSRDADPALRAHRRGRPEPTSCRLDGGRATRLLGGTVLGVRPDERAYTPSGWPPWMPSGTRARPFFTWTVDVGAPKVRLAGHPDPFTTSTIATFRLWSRTDPALFLCMLDGLALMPCDDDNYFGSLTDGRHSLVVWGLDAAMNRSHAVTYRWTVDTIPPGLILTGTPEEGAVTADRAASFEIWQSEPGIALLFARRGRVRTVHVPGRCIWSWPMASTPSRSWRGIVPGTLRSSRRAPGPWIRPLRRPCSRGHVRPLR